MKVKLPIIQALSLILLLSGPTAWAQFPVQCIDDATISLRGGGTEVITCEGDGLAETYRFRTSSLAMPFAYLITDENNIILDISIGSTLSFEGLGEGNFRVWAFAWLGQITAEIGQDATAGQLATVCSALTTNFIPVVNFVPDGGTVATADGSTSQFICPDDGLSDVVEFTSTGDMSAGYVYLLTDENNIILEIINGNSFDFETLPEGNYRIWGLSYAGNLTAEPGDDAASVLLSDACFGLSSNFIAITRALPDGGTVALSNGMTEALICVNDGQSDVLTFTNQSTASATYAYLVTDENNIVLSVVTGDSFDFETADPGICRVWGVSYTGDLTVSPGDDAAAIDLSDGCFSLSSNFITVTRQEADGGMVELASGGTETFACVGDGAADIFEFVNTSAGADEYTYLITDENNIILAFAPDGSFDFEGAGIGECRIWGLAYGGTLLAEVGDNAATAVLADGCFGLSANFITVRRESVDGGMVFTDAEEVLLYTCPGDGIADVYTFVTDGSSTGEYAYVITTEDLIIVGLADGDSFDFDELPEGTYLVWGLAYTGNLAVGIGDSAAGSVNLSDECFELSSSVVTVIVQTPDGGSVATEDGETTVFTCPGDGVADIVRFDSTGTSASPYTYVVTDEDNKILALVSGDSFDFDGAPIGTCRVWGLAYTGLITAQVGDDAAAVALSDDCFDLSDNFITVVREKPNGGTVELEGGGDLAYTCPGDGMADVLAFDSLGTSSGPYVYVVTDEDNNILALASGDSFDFEGAPAGTCRVWGLAYTGNIIAQVGDNAAAVDLSDDCFDLSDNFITVVRETPDGGSVALEGGGDNAALCPDGNNTVLSFENAGASAGPYVYVITDDENFILDVVSSGSSYDFGGLAQGFYRVWGLSYTGSLIAQVGDDAAAVPLSDDCFALSGNFIAVALEAPMGGTVSLEGGGDIAFICPGDGLPNVLAFDSTGTAGPSYIYVVTDQQNIILDVFDGDTYDFETDTTDIVRVWGLAYTGNLTAQIGDDAAAVALSDDCFSLSDNFVDVVRELPFAGRIETEDGETEVITCPGDGVADVIAFDSLLAGITPFTYVITDENNIIVALPAGDSFDFETLPEGNVRVWGLAYTGNLTAQIGDDAATAALSDDCFLLSDNFVTILREAPVGGMVELEGGGNIAFICPGDGLPNVLAFDSTGTAGPFYTYVVTTQQNIIIDTFDGDTYDFETDTTDIVRVWGLAYTGNLIAMPGDTASIAALSDECFSLSANFVDIVRELPFGGLVETEDGQTEVYTCPGDGMPDVIAFDSMFAAITPYAYVITDENNIILALPSGDSFDFDGAPAGTCRVWGLSYTGNITAQIGDDAAAVDLTDECFDLSSNFITVVREVPEGGTVATTAGETLVYTCPGDGIADLVSAVSAGTSTGAYTYVITDENNIILDLPAGDTFDFDGADPGNCRIWGLAYTGSITAQIGDDAAAVALSDDCFDLSDNFITVVRDAPEGGTVATDEGETTVSTCPGDGNADILVFENMGANGLYAYVITDTSNIITHLLAGDSFDFDGEDDGISRVWGLAYTGSIIAEVGDDAAAVALSDDCFDLSDNFVTVIHEVPNGGTVNLQGGDTEAYVCPGDGTPDVLFLENDGGAGDFIYLLTDENNIVLTAIDVDTIDFDELAPNTYRIWGLSYTGNLALLPGAEVLVDVLADDCFAVSDNFIAVFSQQPVGGTVATAAGETDILICALGDPDTVVFDSMGTAGQYIYVITNEDNIILDVFTGDSYDFSSVGAGVLRVWGLAYTGNLTAQIGDDAAAVALSDDCFDLSSNFVTLTRLTPDAGEISTEDGNVLEFCAGDGVPDVVTFDVQGATNNPYLFVVTDEDGFIVNSIDQTFDFENIVPGTYRVYGVSYLGTVGILPGANIFFDPLSDGCYDVSDSFVEIQAIGVDGGLIATDLGPGIDDISLCIGDGESDLLQFTTTSATPDANYIFVITNENGVILATLPGDEFDFESVPGSGIIQVWGISYTGNLLVTVGQVVTSAELSDGCGALSENFLTIRRGLPQPTTIATGSGATEALVCLDPDGLLDFTASGASPNAYVYLLTDENNIVIEVITGSSYDFAQQPEGVYRVWGLSYAGLLNDLIGEDAAAIELATSCHELSNNFITVTRGGEVDGGILSEIEGRDTVLLCPGGEEPDFVVMSTTSQAGAYRYIITDTDNRVIVDDISLDIIDFTGAMPGVYRIWGASLLGDMNLGFGDEVPLTPASDTCFQYSENFVTVIYESPEAGTILTEAGEDQLTIMVDDTAAAEVDFIKLGASMNTPYLLLMTDTDNNILDIIDGSSIDFTNASVGVCRIWGFAYTGTLLAFPGADAATAMLSSDCWDLSGNFVTVNKVDGLGGGNGAELSANLPAEAIRLHLAPNPAREFLNLQFDLGKDAAAETQLRVINSQGQLLHGERVGSQAGANTHTLSVENWPAGMYIIQLYNGQSVEVQQFMVVD